MLFSLDSLHLKSFTEEIEHNANIMRYLVSCINENDIKDENDKDLKEPEVKRVESNEPNTAETNKENKDK